MQKRTEYNYAVQNAGLDIVNAVVHHKGRWFDPHVIAANAEITIHLVVVNDGLISIPSLDMVEKDLLYWVKAMADTLHGNTRSKVRRALAYLKRLEPYVQKGDFDKDVLFFSELRRTNALIERTLAKRRGYNNKIEQRFAYLRVVLARYNRTLNMDKLYVFRVDKETKLETRLLVGQSKTQQILDNIESEIIG